MRTAFKNRRLFFVHQVVIDMPQLMMQGTQLFLIDLDALFDARIIATVDIPGTGMTDDTAIPWFFDHRVLIKTVWQCRQPQRSEKALCSFGHLHLVIALLDQCRGDIQRGDALVRLHNRIDIIPGLRPHITQ